MGLSDHRDLIPENGEYRVRRMTGLKLGSYGMCGNVVPGLPFVRLDGRIKNGTKAGA